MSNEDNTNEASTLSRLINAANEQELLTTLITDAEEQLKQRKEDLRRVVEDTIPTLLSESGLQGLTLRSGKTISIKKSYFASIPKKDPVKATAAFKWLFDNGYKDTVKRVIKAPIESSREETFSELEDYMAENNIQFDLTRDINAQTLKKIVKETMEEGKDIPMDVFGIFVKEESVIK